VETIKFDKNFMNYEDPEVLERFLGPDYKEYWKNTYGFDYVTKLPGKLVVRGNITDIEIEDYPLSVHCVKAEFR
jgi:hypothetical protein